MDNISLHTGFPTTAGDDSPLLRREDLSALGAAYLSHSGNSRQWGGVAAAMGGIVLGWVLIVLGGQLDWPHWLAPVFFFGGWAVFLTFGAFVWLRGRKLHRLFELRCPACEDFLLNGIRNREGIPPLIELIAATGSCPHCKAQIVAS